MPPESAPVLEPAPSLSPAPQAAWRHRARLGLLNKTRLWSMLVVAMTLSLTALTHSALLRWQQGLEQITTHEFDALMEAVRLVQQSEVLVSQSLALAQARSVQERRVQWVDQQDRLEWVRKITQGIAQNSKADRALLDRVTHAQDALGQQATALNTLVQQRLLLRANGNDLALLMGYFSADVRAHIAQSKQHLADQVQTQLQGLWAFALGLIALVLLMGFYVQRRVVARVLGLQRAVSRPAVDVRELNPPGHDEIDQLTRTVGHFVQRIQADEAALKRVNTDLIYLSEHDTLTQLANRRHFDAAVRRILPALRSPLALAVFDIDHFKQVNDVHGHDVGDQALIHVARSLSAGLRERDVLARFGGEEFIVLLPVASLDAALEVCERMRMRVADSPLMQSDAADAAPLALSVSAGLALITGLPLLAADAQVAHLMQHTFTCADQALYSAKANGRNRVCVWPEAIDATIGAQITSAPQPHQRPD